MDLRSIRKRQVVQWTLAYGAFALGAVALLDSLGDVWAISLTAQRRLQILLAMGLPLAVLVSWYHGEKGRQRIDRTEALSIVAWALVTAGVLVWVPPASGETNIAGPDSETVEPWERPDRRRIAVLPFSEEGSAAADELGRRTAEQVRLQLVNVARLRVIAGGSLDPLGFDVGLEEIDTHLGSVRYLVRGSVVATGTSLTARIQLSETTPSGAEDLLWAETFTGGTSATALLSVQQDIALSLLDALPVESTGEERARIARAPTNDDELLRLLRQAQRLEWELDMEQNAAAGALLEAALAQDSTFADAHAWLAGIYARRGMRSDDWATVERGRAHARAAFRLAPESPHSLMGLAYSLIPYERFEEMRDINRRLLRLEPSYPFAFRNLGGIAYYSGNFTQAAIYFTEALALDPGDPTAALFIGRIWLMLGEADRAEAWFDYLVEEWPFMRGFLVNQVNNLLVSGDTTAAHRYAIDLTEQIPQLPTTWANRALMAVRVGDAQDAVMSAERFTEIVPHFDMSRGWTWAMIRGVVYHHAGDSAEAAVQLAEAERRARLGLDRGDESWEPRIEMARVTSLRGDLDAAQMWAEEAVAAGWRGVPTLLGLEPLFGRPDFQRLLERAQRDRLAQLRYIEGLGLGIELPPVPELGG